MTMTFRSAALLAMTTAMFGCAHRRPVTEHPDACGSHVECYNLALKRLADAESRIDAYQKKMDERLVELVPPGTILAWLASTPLPKGWSVCDGTNGVPDLRGRYLRAAPDAASRGLAEGGEPHQHAIAIVSQNPRPENGGVPDGWTVPNGNSKAPHATGMDHRHKIVGDAAAASTLPPTVRVVFLCRRPQ